MSLINFAKDAY